MTEPQIYGPTQLVGFAHYLISPMLESFPNNISPTIILGKTAEFKHGEQGIEAYANREWLSSIEGIERGISQISPNDFMEMITASIDENDIFPRLETGIYLTGPDTIHLNPGDLFRASHVISFSYEALEKLMEINPPGSKGFKDYFKAASIQHPLIRLLSNMTLARANGYEDVRQAYTTFVQAYQEQNGPLNFTLPNEVSSGFPGLFREGFEDYKENIFRILQPLIQSRFPIFDAYIGSHLAKQNTALPPINYVLLGLPDDFEEQIGPQFDSVDEIIFSEVKELTLEKFLERQIKRKNIALDENVSAFDVILEPGITLNP